MEVTLFNKQRDLSISTQSVEAVVSFLLSKLKIASDEVVLHFVGKKKICQLHQLYFNDPSPTDCISFPMDSPKPKKSGPTVLGEIFVCPKVAIEYAKAHNIDPYEETTRYVVHGLLHLLGFDDLIPTERKKMRSKENLCMKWLMEQELFLNNNF